VAHNIEFFTYAGEPAWHGLGKQLQNVFTSEEAFEQTPLLGSPVVQRTIYIRNADGEFVPVKGRLANVREEDDQFLGIVSDDYVVLQNRESFRIVDEAIAELGIDVLYETAASLRDGKQMFALARLPEDLVIKGDTTRRYFLIGNSHDGSTGVDIRPTAIRVVCNNTYNAAVANREDDDIALSFTHRGNVEEKILATKAKLLEVITLHREFGDLASKLVELDVTDETFNEFLDRLFPRIEIELNLPGAKGVFKLNEVPDGVKSLVPATALKANDHREKRLDAFQYVWNAEKEAFGPTFLSLFNATTGYADHQRPFATRKAGVSRFTSAIQGDGHLIKHTALDIIKELANV
jgi:phage/plasmid-like protein (TIGR03299 family)